MVAHADSLQHGTALRWIFLLDDWPVSDHRQHDLGVRTQPARSGVPDVLRGLSQGRERPHRMRDEAALLVVLLAVLGHRQVNQFWSARAYMTVM